jgi:hypothetical protein
MRKQTAVEWLVNKLFDASGVPVTEKNNPKLFELIKQAKAMERNQIMIAHYAGESPRIIHNNSIEYYTSTYE